MDKAAPIPTTSNAEDVCGSGYELSRNETNGMCQTVLLLTVKSFKREYSCEGQSEEDCVQGCLLVVWDVDDWTEDIEEPTERGLLRG